VKFLYYQSTTLEFGEIQQLARIFPNLTYIRVDAENVLEHQLKLKELSHLECLHLGVLASDQFDGEIDS